MFFSKKSRFSPLFLIPVLSLFGCNSSDLGKTLHEELVGRFPGYSTSGYVAGKIVIPHRSSGETPVMYVQGGASREKMDAIVSDQPYCEFYFDQFKWTRPGLARTVNVQTIPFPTADGTMWTRSAPAEVDFSLKDGVYRVSVFTRVMFSREMENEVGATEVKAEASFRCLRPAMRGCFEDYTGLITLRELGEILKFTYRMSVPRV